MHRDGLEREFSHLAFAELAAWNHNWPDYLRHLLLSREDQMSAITDVATFFDGDAAKGYLVRCLNRNTGEVDYMAFSSVGPHRSCAECDGAGNNCPACRGSCHASIEHEAHWFPGYAGTEQSERLSRVQLVQWAVGVVDESWERLISKLNRARRIEPDQEGIE